MSKTPNYKAEAHKAITRILSLDSRVQRERVLAEFLRDIHDRGEVASLKSHVTVVQKKRPKQEKTGDPLADSVFGFMVGLKDLGATLGNLSKELAEVL